MSSARLASALLVSLALVACAAPSEQGADVVEFAHVTSRSVVARHVGSKPQGARAKGGIDPLVPRQVVQVLDRLGVTTGGVYTPASGWAGTATSDLSMAGYDITGVKALNVDGDPEDGDQFSFTARHGASFVATNGTLAFASPLGKVQFSASGGTGTVTVLAATTNVSGVTSATVSAQIQDYSSATTLSLTEAQFHGQTYRLTGSALQTINIPDAGASLDASEVGGTATFICQNTAGVKLVFGTGDTCTQPGLGTTASAGYLYSKWTGSTITVTRTAAATFVGERINGTWGKDSTTTAGFAFTPTAWTDTNCTDSWSNATTNMHWRQVGDAIEGWVTTVCTGDPGGSVGWNVTWPSATVGTPLLTGYEPASTNAALGTGVGYDLGSAIYPITAWYGAGTLYAYTGGGAMTAVSSSSPGTFRSSGDAIHLDFRVQVQ